MRFGCGSHMAYGHHGNKKLVDPVCGLKIGEQESYGKLQDGVLFRFCSKKCFDEFDQNPEKYILQSISKKLKEYRDET